MLAQRHDVHVVVDQAWGVVVLGEAVTDRVAVPARHDRRVYRPAGGELDRAGDADTHRHEIVVGLHRAHASRRVEVELDLPEHRFGPGGDVEVDGLLGEQLAGEVGDAEPGVGGAEVGDEHPAGIAVEGEEGGWTATGGRGVPNLGHQPVGDEPVDPEGDRGACQPGGAGDGVAGGRLAATDQLQDLSGGSHGAYRHSSASQPPYFGMTSSQKCCAFGRPIGKDTRGRAPGLHLASTAAYRAAWSA